jgi:hypothetical protein
VEDCDERLSSALVDQFLGMIDETLPPPPELLEDAEAQKEEAVIKADEEGMRNLDKGQRTRRMPSTRTNKKYSCILKNAFFGYPPLLQCAFQSLRHMICSPKQGYKEKEKCLLCLSGLSQSTFVV